VGKLALEAHPRGGGIGDGSGSTPSRLAPGGGGAKKKKRGRAARAAVGPARKISHSERPFPLRILRTRTRPSTTRPFCQAVFMLALSVTMGQSAQSANLSRGRRRSRTPMFGPRHAPSAGPTAKDAEKNRDVVLPAFRSPADFSGHARIRRRSRRLPTVSRSNPNRLSCDHNRAVSPGSGPPEPSRTWRAREQPHTDQPITAASFPSHE